MVVSHLGLHVRDLDKCLEFYDAALKPLGYKRQITVADGKVVGYGQPMCGPDFWISGLPGAVPEGYENKSTGEWEPIHFAFAAKNRRQVRQFYEAAM